MDPEALQEKLFRAARGNVPPDAVPFLFTKRVMAHLQAQPAPDPLVGWAQALWRAAAPCVAVALMLGTWTMFEPDSNAAQDEFAQHFENAVFADIGSDQAMD